MLPQSIIDMVLAKYGKHRIFSADCAPLGHEIGLSETTIKRMFGLVGPDSKERNRIPHKSTMEILAKWLGYDNYESLLREIGEKDCSSEFTAMESIDLSKLTEGTRIKLTYHPSRTLLLEYLGSNRFMVEQSINSKLQKDDTLLITHLIKNQELIAGDVVRNGISLGPYRAAKEGGLTSLVIMD